MRRVDLDVLVLDMSMPGKSGMDLIRQIKAEKPKLRIVVLTMHQENQYAVRAIRAGASGYLTKDSASAQLVHAIRKVAAGGAFISAEVAEQLAHRAQGGRRRRAARRAVRPRVPGAAAAGGRRLADRRSAKELHLSVKTISTHKSHILEKLGLANQTELIRYAIAHGLAEPLDGG